ncbi:MAG: M24 family metallopeptidase [Acidobacteriota bacterium]
MSQLEIHPIQVFLKDNGLEGWLLYDFRGQNPISRRMVRFPEDRFATRRWFYFIPAQGDPVAVVHAIESHHLDYLPGSKLTYAGWRQMRERLSEATEGATLIAMEYSPECNIPYLSRVDAGTVELLRGLGKSIESSADLVSLFESRLTEHQIELHRQAAAATIEAKDQAFSEIGRRLKHREPVSEFRIQQFIVEQFSRLGLVTSSPPIVAVNEHSGDPHYSPTASSDRYIRPGDLVLIDLWAKVNHPEGVYADFTWVGYAGPGVPAPIQDVWDVVRGARDAAVNFITSRVEQGETFRGFEVDDAARSFIENRGYGPSFIHRTGHNIGLDVHGNGTHMDNFETRDERKVLPFTCFSVEPGIYLKEFGIRSEVDVLLREDGVEVSGQPVQREVLCLLGEG